MNLVISASKQINCMVVIKLWLMLWPCLVAMLSENYKHAGLVLLFTEPCVNSALRDIKSAIMQVYFLE